MNKQGALLVNLGSPAFADRKSVRQFLRVFLGDRRVVETPRVIWFFVLNLMVLPFRPQKSARAYQKIWREDGSPLMVFSHNMAAKLAAKLAGENILVSCAMRYSQPDIYSALLSLQQQGCENIVVLPLYPQYSATTSATIVDECGRALLKFRNQPQIRYIKDFHADEKYIHTMAQHIGSFWREHGRAQKLLLSFHGLPQSYVAKGDPYRRQCELSAHLLAEKLALKTDEWQLCFQSRFGREHWLQPYTDQTLIALGRQGLPSLDVFCPGFSADCLETLEEIAITGKQQFQQAGGGELNYISALNDSDAHIELLADLVHKNL